MPVVAIIVLLLIAVVAIASLWCVFQKAGQPGWAAIVPIYNWIILLKIVGRPLWWILLLMIPFVNFVIMILLCIDLAKSFGQGTGFGVGLALVGIVFFPILGFGKAQYVGPAVAPAPAA